MRRLGILFGTTSVEISVIIATLSSGSTVASAEQIKRDIQGISLGMPLAEALKVLAQKECGPIKASQAGTGMRLLVDTVECSTSGEREEFILYYSRVLTGHPVWIVQYYFDSKLSRDQLCSAVGAQFGFKPARGCAKENITDYVTVSLATSIVHYVLELVDNEIPGNEDRFLKERRTRENPAPRF